MSLKGTAKTLRRRSSHPALLPSMLKAVAKFKSKKVFQHLNEEGSASGSSASGDEDDAGIERPVSSHSTKQHATPKSPKRLFGHLRRPEKNKPEVILQNFLEELSAQSDTFRLLALRGVATRLAAGELREAQSILETAIKDSEAASGNVSMSLTISRIHTGPLEPTSPSGSSASDASAGGPFVLDKSRPTSPASSSGRSPRRRKGPSKGQGPAMSPKASRKNTTSDLAALPEATPGEEPEQPAELEDVSRSASASASASEEEPMLPVAEEALEPQPTEEEPPVVEEAPVEEPPPVEEEPPAEQEPPPVLEEDPVVLEEEPLVQEQEPVVLEEETGQQEPRAEEPQEEAPPEVQEPQPVEVQEEPAELAESTPEEEPPMRTRPPELVEELSRVEEEPQEKGSESCSPRRPTEINQKGRATGPAFDVVERKLRAAQDELAQLKAELQAEKAKHSSAHQEAYHAKQRAGGAKVRLQLAIKKLQEQSEVLRAQKSTIQEQVQEIKALQQRLLQSPKRIRTKQGNPPTPTLQAQPPLLSDSTSTPQLRHVPSPCSTPAPHESGSFSLSPHNERPDVISSASSYPADGDEPGTPSAAQRRVSSSAASIFEEAQLDMEVALMAPSMIEEDDPAENYPDEGAVSSPVLNALAAELLAVPAMTDEGAERNLSTESFSWSRQQSLLADDKSLLELEVHLPKPPTADVGLQTLVTVYEDRDGVFPQARFELRKAKKQLQVPHGHGMRYAPSISPEEAHLEMVEQELFMLCRLGLDHSPEQWEDLFAGLGGPQTRAPGSAPLQAQLKQDAELELLRNYRPLTSSPMASPRRRGHLASKGHLAALTAQPGDKSPQDQLEADWSWTAEMLYNSTGNGMQAVPAGTQAPRRRRSKKPLRGSPQDHLQKLQLPGLETKQLQAQALLNQVFEVVSIEEREKSPIRMALLKDTQLLEKSRQFLEHENRRTHALKIPRGQSPPRGHLGTRPRVLVAESMLPASFSLTLPPTDSWFPKSARGGLSGGFASRSLDSR